MADETPPRRLLSLLRRRPRAKTSEHTRDSNLLWLSHERASTSVKQATDAIQQISSNIARQRTALDAALDRSRVVYTRADQFRMRSRNS
jgi:hypothetical protein